MTAAEIRELSRKIRFDCSEQEAARIAADLAVLPELLALFDDIDTTDTEEMVFPFDGETFFLREDIPEEPLSQEEALANAPSSREGQVAVPRVVF